MKMTVLHVFFLVLGMWPVHSYGRAYESESIVNNNTQQLYKENMNTVLSDYDYFYLVMLWPNSFCLPGNVICFRHLRQPPPNYFVLHGLWPQKNDVPQITCSVTMNTPLFNSRQLFRNGSLVYKMNNYWPNLKVVPNEAFWEHEYKKHGSCFFRTQDEYFVSTDGMMDQIPDLTRKLELRGITPGHSYQFDYLQRKISQATGFFPKLECDRISRLYQMYFCADRSKRLVNCISPYRSIKNSCGSDVRLP